MTERVLRWKAAWESRDPNVVAALYADDATHASALVPHLYPEVDGAVLHGVEQVREYARRGLARFSNLEFRLATVVEDATRSAVEYRRHSNVDGDHPAHVLELLEWRGERLATVRVFHFAPHAPEPR